MSQNPYIEFDQQTFMAFAEHFYQALEKGQTEFTFQGHTVLTEYARYVMEYLGDTFDPHHSKN